MFLVTDFIFRFYFIGNFLVTVQDLVLLSVTDWAAEEIIAMLGC
jgi:hypothetical protein